MVQIRQIGDYSSGKVSAEYSPPKNRDWVYLSSWHDRSHTTCQQTSARQDRVSIELKETFAVTWLRIVAKNAEHIAKIKIESEARSAYSCRTTKLDSKTVDFVCSDIGVTNEIFFSNLDGIKVCEIYISKGRNVALHQATTQSSTFYGWGRENVVNGNLGTIDGYHFELSTECTHTNEGDSRRGFWRVTFLHPMNIIGADIYNRRNQSEGSLQDSDCPSGKFGRECERDCNCADDQDACFVATGGCPSGCAPGYTGEDCWTRRPVFKICAVTLYQGSKTGSLPPLCDQGRPVFKICKSCCTKAVKVAICLHCAIKVGQCLKSEQFYRIKAVKLAVCLHCAIKVDLFLKSVQSHCTKAVKLAICLHCAIKFVMLAVMDNIAHKAVVSTALVPTAPAILLMGHVTRAVSWATRLHFVIKSVTMEPMALTVLRHIVETALVQTTPVALSMGHVTTAVMLAFSPHSVTKLKYGLACAQNCSSHCAGPNNTCDPFGGSCDQGCEAGYQPPLCDQESNGEWIWIGLVIAAVVVIAVIVSVVVKRRRIRSRSPDEGEGLLDDKGRHGAAR
ncbi:receptor-type tyrosine-protein phosphatase kappa-like [Plakobranchus ocellatus]|uniref:Receptor-type tyrosine-protein phosphatase kappa-like n=1 Tax=Plakobranchus ocellatus TaxID=259542 RepID=A0AAV4A6N4_9GAST|nr:receptor-type tyrosine-protein phosphatase kappa-like [Plakobranchus ocellatus]